MNLQYVLTLLAFIVCLPMNALAQRVSHTYDNVSLSDALLQLSTVSKDYTINFLYNELEDFRITTTVNQKKLPRRHPSDDRLLSCAYDRPRR